MTFRNRLSQDEQEKVGPVLRHPMFLRLAMHDDAELADMLGEVVRRRETIREWPLSWTQRVELADGRAFAYKSQLPPLVEADFYAAADSPLLPGHRLPGRIGDCSTVLVDWVDAPSLADAGLGEADVVAHATEVVERIGEIGGHGLGLRGARRHQPMAVRRRAMTRNLPTQ